MPQRLEGVQLPRAEDARLLPGHADATTHTFASGNPPVSKNASNNPVTKTAKSSPFPVPFPLSPQPLPFR